MNLNNTARKSWIQPALHVYGDVQDLTLGVGQGKVMGNCDDLGAGSANPPSGPPGNPFGCGGDIAS